MNILITGAALGIGNALMNECINHNHFVIGIDINKIENSSIFNEVDYYTTSTSKVNNIFF